jgi:hypothetical protein
MKVLSIVQMSRRQCAVTATLPQPIAQHSTSCVRLARVVRCRSRDRSQGQQDPLKSEGKIKGPARCRPLSQSARGVGAARRLVAGVPSQNANPQGVSGDERMPSLTWVTALSWMCHGLA